MNIRPKFNVHILNNLGLAKARHIAEIETLVPAKRERASVITKFQEAGAGARLGISNLISNRAEP